MSPRPAAPRRAPVTACSTTAASEWRARPRGCSTRTPPSSSGRPSTSRWVSCPMPTRMRASPLDVEPRVDVTVFVAHVLLQVRQHDLAGRAVALLADDDLDLALAL